MIRSPVLQRDEQARAIGAIGEHAGANPLTRNFLGLLARNRRLFALPEMIQGFLRILAERRGEVTAQMIAAQELSASQRQAVDERLCKAVGGKVAVDFRVDPSLLGGPVVKEGMRMVDVSRTSKLALLALVMKGAGYVRNLRCRNFRDPEKADRRIRHRGGRRRGRSGPVG